MAAFEFDALLGYFKALADENRFKIACLASVRAYTVGELAEVLGLTEPTISHHITRLRDAGLLNLNAVGTKRYYKLNDDLFTRAMRQMTPATLASISEHVLATADTYRERTDQHRADVEAWLDDQNVSDFDRKVLKDYTAQGRLKQIPTRQNKLMAVLRWLVREFEPERQYTEREVNDILRRYNEDYARLRRELVDARFLTREGGGERYWRTPEVPA